MAGGGEMFDEQVNVPAGNSINPIQRSHLLVVFLCTIFSHEL